MKDGDRTDRGNHPDTRRTRRSTPASRQGGYVSRPSADGRSGYGSESVRPHLRQQLKMKELLSSPRLGSGSDNNKPE